MSRKIEKPRPRIPIAYYSIKGEFVPVRTKKRVRSGVASRCHTCEKRWIHCGCSTRATILQTERARSNEQTNQKEKIRQM